VRSGIIRLGHKEKRKRQDGSEYEFPVQDSHFVLTDAPEIAEVYGAEPRELDVILPFPDIARNFDAFYTVWAGGVLVCKGDGEYVQYAVPFRTEVKDERTRVYNISGDTQVSDGQAQTAFKWNGQEFKSGDLVPCSGAAQDLYPQCAACRKSALLKIMMAKPELIRCGYYQLATTSGRNYDTILGTLEMVSAGGQRPVNGIPFTLRLVEEAITYTEQGKRKATKKWFVQLEPSPVVVRALYQLQARALLGASTDTQADPVTGEITDEWEEVEPEAPPPFAEEGGPAEEPEPEPEPEPKAEKQPLANGQWSRPMNPTNTRYSLRFRGGWVKGEDPYFADAHRQPDDKQEPPNVYLVKRVAAMMGKALTRPEGGDTDLERHLILSWVFGIESTSLLTALEVQATAKWLEAFPAGQGEDGKDAWIPSGVASEECRLVLHQAMVDAGQMELQMEHDHAE